MKSLMPAKFYCVVKIDHVKIRTTRRLAKDQPNAVFGDPSALGGLMGSDAMSIKVCNPNIKA